jgi:hypothetical protein
MVGLLVVALVAGLLGWAFAVEPGAATPSQQGAEQVPLALRTVVCPQIGGTPNPGSAVIAFGDASRSGSSDNFSLVSTPVDPDGVSSAVPAPPAAAWTGNGPSTLGPVMLSAHGPLATNLGVTQVTSVTIAKTRQLSATPCGEPTTDSWFAGFSTGVGSHATLLLSNIDDVPATVDVGVYSDDAPPDPQAQHGIPVAPHTQAAIRLDTVAPALSNVALHVHATTGRVAPALRYDVENGSIPLGVAWVPPADGPATTQTVPGIVGGDGTRRLVLAAPGDLDAVAQVTVVTPDGSFTPTGMDAIDVPAGQLTTVDLDATLAKAAAAIVVHATEPVVAAARMELPLNKSGGSDVAFAAAAPALSGPTIVAGGRSNATAHTRLVLSAPAEDAHVEVTLLPSTASAPPVQSSLDVPGGTTTTLDVSSLSKDPAPAVTLTPGAGGPVYAAWTLLESDADSAGLAAFPLRSPVRSLDRPPVTADLLAGLPPGAGEAQSPSPSSSQPFP